ncbi:hypothetical protein [Vulcanisaeta distributa]|uniref:Uncharacterized protein n=1 Tax=Vulcanisaeta distributa (strain DSM 14429 / JCM 11212 / NBRC 100878 / IC-017) TaxID=572478 RepID=E1QU71_VULDI|nr:hypothetical protein [Vulcanisaeta distributa]ADN51065.1 hypothetical protein Vdis_1691 [Vulcanisaeta distributa DSM 14429]
MSTWEYTTLGWFKMNALAAALIPSPSINEDNIGNLQAFVQALLQQGVNNVQIPLTNNDLQTKSSKTSANNRSPTAGGPLGKIINSVFGDNANAVIGRIQNVKRKYIPGNIALDIALQILNNGKLWYGEVDRYSVAPKVFVAELPGNAKLGFLDYEEVSKSKLFAASLIDVALGLIGAVLTYVYNISNRRGHENEAHYFFLGLSPNLWQRIGGSAKEVLDHYRSINRMFSSVIDLNEKKVGLITDFAFIYAAARIKQYLLKHVTKEEVLQENYYMDLLTLSRSGNTQNFIVNLNTVSLNDYLVAISRSNTAGIIIGIGGLLKNWDKVSKGNSDLGESVIDVANTVTENITRFTSNGDCHEIAELSHAVTVFINEWNTTFINLSNKNSGIQHAYNRLRYDVNKIRC